MRASASKRKTLDFDDRALLASGEVHETQIVPHLPVVLLDLLTLLFRLADRVGHPLPVLREGGPCAVCHNDDGVGVRVVDAELVFSIYARNRYREPLAIRGERARAQGLPLSVVLELDGGLVLSVERKRQGGGQQYVR